MDNRDMVCLFIDDDLSILRSLKMWFFGKNDVFFEECHSTKEAIAAIEKIKPNVLFLDHSLTGSSGNQGFEVVKHLNNLEDGNILKNLRIYSITENRSEDVRKWYISNDVAMIGKLGTAPIIRQLVDELRVDLNEQKKISVKI